MQLALINLVQLSQEDSSSYTRFPTSFVRSLVHIPFSLRPYISFVRFRSFVPIGSQENQASELVQGKNHYTTTDPHPFHLGNYIG